MTTLLHCRRPCLQCACCMLCQTVPCWIQVIIFHVIRTRTNILGHSLCWIAVHRGSCVPFMVLSLVYPPLWGPLSEFLDCCACVQGCAA
jgi:hypothetical protein